MSELNHISKLLDEAMAAWSRLHAAVMDAVFYQERPGPDARRLGWHYSHGPIPLCAQLAEGALYDEDVGSMILLHHAFEKNERWVLAPDGTRITSGAELVAWRDARWAAMDEAEALQASMDSASQPAPRRKRL